VDAATHSECSHTFRPLTVQSAGFLTEGHTREASEAQDGHAKHQVSELKERAEHTQPTHVSDSLWSAGMDAWERELPWEAFPLSNYTFSCLYIVCSLETTGISYQ
jgi:hypothetical protein